MRLPLKTILSTGALLAAGGYLLYSFLGPNGVPMVLEKRREIRELQRQNADIEREIQERSERIRRFAESPSEQDRRFREDLKLLKKGETTFVTQDEPAP
ncbi:MAG: septum formation initiator family protein [Bryobacteraceae bacterium]